MKRSAAFARRSIRRLIHRNISQTKTRQINLSMEFISANIWITLSSIPILQAVEAARTKRYTAPTIFNDDLHD